MRTIYEPTGKAREYSPYALNIYQNCDHKCEYCYVKSLFAAHHFEKPSLRIGLLKALNQYAPKHRYKEQVLLSFSGDPYCKEDVKIKATREVLKILLGSRIPVAILTKGGERCLRDLDLFKKFDGMIKVGATLTFIDHAKSLQIEPGAALPKERFDTLKKLHNKGIKTWVSLEPVIEVVETINVIEATHSFVDHYKLGLTNYYQLPSKIDWSKLIDRAVYFFRKYNKPFYIKNDLQKFISDRSKFSKEELSPDTLFLKPEKPATLL